MERNDNKKGITKGIRHALALVLFCMVMSVGMVCFADEQGTVTVASAKIRASADASSEQLGSVAQGGTVDIIGKTTGTDGKTWYQVYVDANTKGFIRGDLVKLKDGAQVKNVQASDTSAQGTDTTPTEAASTEARRATVKNNNVRIRKGASTNHDVVATANRGMVVTVTGETNGSDGNKWYQVSFTYNDKDITGFIRSDLVTFDDVPADVASSEITGNAAGEEQNQETQPQEEQPQETPEQAGQSNANEVIPMEAEELPYVMPGFTAFKLAHEGQEYEAFRNGIFYIIYGQKGDGETGWFLFDSDKKIYTRYPYTVAGVTEPSGKTVGLLPVIVLVIIVVILVAVVGLLLLKLRENAAYGRSYGRNDNYRDKEDDIEDLEDMEDEEDNMPMGRPQGRAVNRPQPQGQSSGGQPVRRPQAQGQPTRRPQRETAGNGASTPQGTSSQGRRPQPQGGQANPQGRRPQPQGGNPQAGGRPQRPANGQANPQGRRPQPQGSPQSGRRPQPQNEKAAAQKGYKAKNLLEEDEDMDFMDI